MPASISLVRRAALTLSALVIGCAPWLAAVAQAPASGTLSIMVPYPAGGASDVIARTVSAPLSKQLGQTVVVENLGGVSGALAAQKVLNAQGSSLYLYQGTPTELILSPLLNSAVKFNADDFQLIQLNTYAPIVLVVRNELPVKNVDELITQAKQAPKDKPLTYGSVGPGSLYHVLGEHLSQRIGVPMTHVPYKGGAPLLQDMAGGNVDFAFLPYFSAIDGMVATGRVRILGQAGASRATTLPNVPTLGEGQLLKHFDFIIWGGYLVKKGTPAATVERLHKALQVVMADPQVRATLEAQSMIIGKPMSLDEAARFYATEAVDYRKLVQAVGIARQ
jgi:tripartite-type tricarboxylate transporter receptor subunit TctC